MHYGKHLLQGGPSERHCRRFCKAQSADDEPDGGGDGQLGDVQSAQDGAPAETILEWLASTRDLVGIRRKDRNKKAWMKIAAHHTDMTVDELNTLTGNLSYELLRRARPRLDIVAMLLWREYFACMNILGWHFS